MSFAKVITCPVCNGQINTDAIRCRSCGALLSDGVTSGGTSQRFKVVLLTVSVLVASVAFFTLNKAGKANIQPQSMENVQPQSVAADQATTR